MCSKHFVNQIERQSYEPLLNQLSDVGSDSTRLTQVTYLCLDLFLLQSIFDFASLFGNYELILMYVQFICVRTSRSWAGALVTPVSRCSLAVRSNRS